MIRYVAALILVITSAAAWALTPAQIGALSSSVASYSFGWYDTATNNLLKEYDISGVATGVTGLTFCSAGTVMVTVDNHTGDIDYFDLSTAYDQSTATQDGAKTLNVLARLPEPSAIRMESAGTLMFLTDFSTEEIVGYDLSTSCTPSTGTINNGLTLDTSSYVTDIRSFEFVTGTELHIGGSTPSEIKVLTLSSSYDPSSVSGEETAKAKNFSADQSSLRGFAYKNSGLDLLIVGDGEDEITPYRLTSAYNPSSAKLGAGKEKDLSGINTFFADIFVDDAQEKIFLSGLVSDSKIYAIENHDPVYVWSQQGSGYSADDHSRVAPLNGTDIALVQMNATDTLSTIRWSGSSFSQVGNALSISGAANNNGIIKMSTTRVALLDQSNETVTAYDWDGTDWSQVGNAYSLTMGFNPSGDYMADNQIVVVTQDGTNDIQVLSFDGTDFSQTGSSLNVATSYADAASLSSTRIAVRHSSGGDTLIAYDWNGSSFSQVGNTYSLPENASGFHGVAAIDSTRVVLSRGNGQMGAYSFDGSDWSPVSLKTAIDAGSNNPNSYAQMSSTLFAYHAWQSTGPAVYVMTADVQN